jgi:pyridoxine 4-dehydrogenase
VKPIQIANAWLLQRSPAMLPIPGTSSVEHLEENIAAAAIRLNEDEFRLLDEVNGKTAAGRVRG